MSFIPSSIAQLVQGICQITFQSLKRNLEQGHFILWMIQHTAVSEVMVEAAAALPRRQTNTLLPIDFRRWTAHLIGYNTDPYRETVSSLILLHRKVRVSYRAAPMEPTGIQFLVWGRFGRAIIAGTWGFYPCPSSKDWSKCLTSKCGTERQSERSKKSNQRLMGRFSRSPEELSSVPHKSQLKHCKFK